MVDLTVSGLTVRLGGNIRLSGVDLRVSSGELVVLLGANGAGKSTLLRCCAGLMASQSGQIWLDGVDPSVMTPIQRARRMAFLPQTRSLAWPVRVRDVVILGRFAYGGRTGRLGPEDLDAVQQALELCDLDGLAERRADAISGGELARVHVARALATRADLILADEPNAALDPLQAWRVLSVLSGFARRGGAALVALHDMSLAARFGTRLVMMHEGRVLADGSPERVMTPENLQKAYGVRAEIIHTGGVWEPRILGPG